jgi:glycosyltransferase involved in cell wall biosynthesis
MKVLFITAWYPNRYDAMAGLFVRKHAEAVSLYGDVKVLYVHADETIHTFDTIEQKFNNVEEIVVYFPVGSRNIFHKAIKTVRFLRAYWQGYKQLTKEGWKPDIVHANILTRTGVMAYLYKKWKGTPYVITEHWTRYLPQNFAYKGFLRRKMTELVVRNASAVMSVSNLLQQAMLKHHLKNPHYSVVDNVVDDFFFEMLPNQICHRTKKRFLLISCFLETAKNVCGILNATKLLSNERDDFELVVIGTGIDFNLCIEHAHALNFPLDMVTFLGEKTPQEVALWLKKSDVCIMFSNYETASVVVAESLASGVPLIATPTGIVPDVINAKNGLLVDFKDEKSLKEKMNTIIDNLETYNATEIQKEAQEKFSYKNVGKKIYEIYSQTVNP